MRLELQPCEREEASGPTLERQREEDDAREHDAGKKRKQQFVQLRRHKAASATRGHGGAGIVRGVPACAGVMPQESRGVGMMTAGTFKCAGVAGWQRPIRTGNRPCGQRWPM